MVCLKEGSLRTDMYNVAANILSSIQAVPLFIVPITSHWPKAGLLYDVILCKQTSNLMQ